MTEDNHNINRRGTHPREGEDTQRRGDRVFKIAGEWYFHTREGTDVGPYSSREKATDEARRLSRIHAHAGTKRAE